MPHWTRHLARYVVLTAITAASIGVMVWVSLRDDSAAKRAREQLTTPVPVVAQPKPLVAIEKIVPAVHEVTSKYSGKIRAWETYSLGFEQPGRIIELGTDPDGRPLDDGSRVVKGQMLARLDDRVLQARVAEATANVEQASSDMRRAREAREGGFGAISEAEYQQYLTSDALAKAALEMATKNLGDAVLYSPVDGVVSRRSSTVGEFVGASATVFEIVENDEVLLVVDVPESKIHTLQNRMRTASEARAQGQGDSESQVFRARVNLETYDRFGKRLPPISAEVFRIGEVADARTGLFEVEIRVPNEQHLLRPGMVATADIVTDRVSAYRIPESAVLFRGEETYVYGLEEASEPLQVMFWQVDTVPLPIAQKIPLADWIDQGDHLLVPTNSAEIDRVVTRGHQRLSDGQHVRVTNSGASNEVQYVTPKKDEGPMARAES
ncbi:efflux RND transporter periplasmic adaptor subunit [Aeoliella sp. SH292]|uniref:efflux RND transporter periplasmic adaptor subunit n=1 Tax=Aeoliella sp. SH292 TaxID=3454464 RepID=UPI003F9945C5